MGKSARKKAKKSKIDFDSLFDSTKPQSEGDGAWHSGISAMALEDDDEYGAPSRPAAAAAAVAPAAAQPKADAMDTADYVPLVGSSTHKHKGLKLQQQSVKIQKRGNRSSTQKQRKAAKQEKGLAHAEKLANRATKQQRKKQQVAALKTLY